MPLPAGLDDLPCFISRLPRNSLSCAIHSRSRIPTCLHIIAASKQRILVPGETVIREGEYGRDLYLILEGLLELVATGYKTNAELPVAILRAW